MYVGFTGTRHGLTVPQSLALTKWLSDYPVTLMRNGCCIGADDEAARTLGRNLIGHPSDLESFVSRRAVALCSVVYDPSPPLARNVLIVEFSDILLACPGGMREEQQSGTWMTIRHARRMGIPVVIFWPDGTVTDGSK